MGKIINSKISADKIVYKIELNYHEARQLKNHTKNTHIFSLDLCQNNSRIIQRGAKRGAKYFVIPLSLKSRKKKKYNKISYQKIENKNKVAFVYVVNKDPLF